MPQACIIKGCLGKSSKLRLPLMQSRHKTEFQINLTKERLNLFLEATSREDLLNNEKIKNTRICSKHYVSGQMALWWDKNNVDWLPTLFLKEEDKCVDMEVDEDEYEMENDLLVKDKNVQTDLTMEEIKKMEITLDTLIEKSSKLEDELLVIKDYVRESNIEQLQDTIKQITEKALQVEKKLGRYMNSQEAFQDNDKRTKFFTGLATFVHLDILFTHLKPHFPKTTCMSQFEAFILTLIKLRLGTTFIDLSYRFDIAENTASRLFHQYLFIMYEKMRSLIIWPERENLSKTMPVNFKIKYQNKTAVIIDCFEVFCEKPSSLDASSQLYSSYKSHHTTKILIGITPQGTISFVSEAYCGRASDKFVTNQSKILDNLRTGDIVMADRGFLVEDEVRIRNASMAMPAFTKGKAQLDPLDVEETRSIANLRIHVERVIGLVRLKYTILSTILPITTLSKVVGDIPVIDQIVTVCSALINLCPSIVVKPNPSLNVTDV